jgi:hypothetical protein
MLLQSSCTLSKIHNYELKTPKMITQFLELRLILGFELL